MHIQLSAKQQGKPTFFVFGNLKPGARGPTAAATKRQADERGVGGVEPCEEQLPPS